MSNDTEKFINDLIEYFKIHTDQIDDFINAKINMKDTMNMYVNAVVKDRLREVVKNMTRYECTNCKKTWYSSDTKAKKCHECNGKLINKGVAK